MKHIGILGHGFVGWGGGLDFLRIILGAMFAEFPPSAHKYYLLLPVDDPELPHYPPATWLSKAIKTLTGKEVPSRRPPPAHLPLHAIKDSLSEFWNDLTPLSIDHRDKRLTGAYRKLRLDIVLPCFLPPEVPADVRWVGYVYDLQHKYLPQLFGEDDIRHREAHFPAMLDRAQSVIVNSQAVADDIRKFYPAHQAQVIALPFCANPNPAWFQVPDARARYGIQRPYFIICNQFWVHKDHRTAFLAFARMAQAFPEVDLVCTGHTTDYRNPQYFDSLQAIIDDSGLRSHVHILGAIPKLDQISLLKQARALIQPTLFEGGPGGGAVFDATSLGVPAIVSDIPVNLELTESTVTFFRTGDEASLADAMILALNTPAPPRAAESDLLEQAASRKKRCGQALRQAIEAANPPQARSGASS